MEADAAKRPEKFSATFFRPLLFITAVTFLFSCKKSGEWIEVDPAFSKYIDAYTTGIVSKTAAIRIQLASAANTVHSVGEEVKEKLFDLSPSVKGKTVWIDASTVEFKPDRLAFYRR